MVAYLNNHEAVKGMTLYDLKMIRELIDEKLDWLDKLAEDYPVRQNETEELYVSRVKRILTIEGNKTAANHAKDLFKLQCDVKPVNRIREYADVG